MCLVSITAFGKAVQCLAKIGEDLHIEALTKGVSQSQHTHIILSGYIQSHISPHKSCCVEISCFKTARHRQGVYVLLVSLYFQLSLRTVNSAHSAFGRFLFRRTFFSSYSDGHGRSGEGGKGEGSEEEEEEEEEDIIRCKITIKVSSPFQLSFRILEPTEKCSFSLQHFPSPHILL